MAISKVSSIASNLQPKILAESLFVAREMNLMAGLVYNYTGQGMSTRYVGIYPEVTAATVAEGVDYSNATEWTKSEQASFTPTTAMAQTLVTDERVATDPEDAVQSAARELGGAIATKIDEDLVNLFSSFTTDKGTAGSAMSIARAAAAMAVLHNNKVRQPFSYVVHPYHWFDVWTELGQPAASKALLGDVANQALADYFVSNFNGANWFTSANISVDSADDAVSGVFHREALGLDTRRGLTLEPERDASKRATEYNMSAWYAVGVRRSDYGIALTADATEPTGV